MTFNCDTSLSFRGVYDVYKCICGWKLPLECRMENYDELSIRYLPLQEKIKFCEPKAEHSCKDDINEVNKQLPYCNSALEIQRNYILKIEGRTKYGLFRFKARCINDFENAPKSFSVYFSGAKEAFEGIKRWKCPIYCEKLENPDEERLLFIKYLSDSKDLRIIDNIKVKHRVIEVLDSNSIVFQKCKFLLNAISLFNNPIRIKSLWNANKKRIKFVSFLFNQIHNLRDIDILLKEFINNSCDLKWKILPKKAIKFVFFEDFKKDLTFKELFFQRVVTDIEAKFRKVIKKGLEIYKLFVTANGGDFHFSVSFLCSHFDGRACVFCDYRRINGDINPLLEGKEEL